MMMAGYPSGVVQIWDTKTWKESARIDTPSGIGSSWLYANPTPDWKTILVDVRTRKLVREEKDGKVSQRMQIDGRIDLYDAATGKHRDSIVLRDRGAMQLLLVPGGKSAFVNTEGSFTAAQSAKRPQFAELVDLASKTTKTLFDVTATPVFAPDGKTAYLARYQYLPGGKVRVELVKYDLASGKELKTLTPPDDQTSFTGVYLSPDGKWLVSTQRKLKPPSQAMVL